MAYGKSGGGKTGKGMMGSMGTPPKSHKRSQIVNMGDGHMMGGRAPGEATGMKSRSYGKSTKMGSTGVGTGSGHPMSGAKSTKSSNKLGTQGITSQGDKGGGIGKGHSTMSGGKNRIGSGRFQTMRG